MNDTALEKYLTDGVEGIVKDALRASLSNPKESRFMLSFAASAKKATSVRAKHEKNGVHIPPFLITGITSMCNLHCAGCYARSNNSCNDLPPVGQLSVYEWGRIFSEAASLGISFILLAGGEPMMRKDVIAEAAKHKSILFPVFTNGTMFDEDYIKLFEANRNLVPVLSSEGGKFSTDNRRGGGIYDSLQKTMEHLSDSKIFFGSSVTVTTANMAEVYSDSFIEGLYSKGCRTVVFVEYVPAVKGTEKLAPADEDRAYAAERLSALREKYSSMLLVSFPGDELASGGCLASGRGFFYINHDGAAEPCPFSPYSDTNVKDKPLIDVLSSPLFKSLREGACLEGSHSGGCVLFEREEEVKAIAGGLK